MLVRRSDDFSEDCSHFYRKGYYLGSGADYRCVLCGDEVSAADIAPLEQDGRDARRD